MLDPFSRGAIVALSTLCVAGAFALAPIRARSSIEETRVQPSPLVGQTASDGVAIVPIRRDPFAESAARDVPAPMAPSPPLQRGTIGSLPSNLTSDTIPAVPGTASDTLVAGARLTAIVTGAHPYAMLDTGQTHEIKGIGDRIEGIAIVSIDLDGIRLQNGRRFTIDAAERP